MGIKWNIEFVVLTTEKHLSGIFMSPNAPIHNAEDRH